jgi:hypothetical protein
LGLDDREVGEPPRNAVRVSPLHDLRATQYEEAEAVPGPRTGDAIQLLAEPD